MLKGRIAELEEQVSDLMMFLDTQSKVAAADAETQEALASGRIMLQQSATAAPTRHKHTTKRTVKPSGVGVTPTARTPAGAGGSSTSGSASAVSTTATATAAGDDDGFASIAVSSKTRSSARR